MKKKSKLISIVVPVYNVEKYLSECVDSLLKQDFNDYEIVLVDDGATDNSGSICDQYAEKYDFIKVVHKPNGGLSDARNVGIQNAVGDYLLFVDSDDYIAEGSLKSISVYLLNHDVDVVFLEALKFFPDGSIYPLGDGYSAEGINGKDKATVMNHLAELPRFPASACSKAIRRQLIIDNNIYFEKGLISEDLDWTSRLLCFAERFAYCDTKYYYYRQGRQGSITKGPVMRSVRAILYIIEIWAKKENEPSHQIAINSFMAYEYMILLKIYAKLEKSDRDEIKNTMKKYAWILKYGKSKRTKMASAMYSILGFRLTTHALSVAYKLTKQRTK